MKPPKQEKTDYEKVDINDFVVGTIEEVQYDQEHKFKGFQGAEDKIKPAVRLKFKINSYKFPHYSRWMAFNYGEKSNLYLKYLLPLVEGAEPDMDFDMDALKGMGVKMLWSEKNGFQNIETIRPANKKIPFGAPKPQRGQDGVPEIQVGDEELQPDEDLPF